MKRYRIFVPRRSISPAKPPPQPAEHHDEQEGCYFVGLQAASSMRSFTVPALRRILQETWQALPRPFPGLVRDAFGITPYQVEFIISLTEHEERIMTLGRVVESFKALAAVAWLSLSSDAGAENLSPLWQRSYHARRLRSLTELEEARLYIRGRAVALGT